MKNKKIKSNPNLGKGLASLLGEKYEEENTNSSFIEIEINKIKANPKQPRFFFDEQKILELSETIKRLGVIEPILLQKTKDNDGVFIIIAGERRFRAAKKAGLKKIPAIIRHANELQTLELSIIENIQRENLSPIEEARAYENWLKLTDKKVLDLAKKVSKDRSTIQNLIRMLKLPGPIIQLVEQKKLSVGQARPLLSIQNTKKAIFLAEKIIQEQWSVRKVETEVYKLSEINSLPSTQVDNRKKDPNILKLEKELREVLKTKIEVLENRKGGGKLSILYSNLSELDRIIEIINK